MDDTDGEVDVVPFVTEVCDQKTWELTPDTKNLDVSVVANPSGATVFGVPKDGGAVRGFRVDGRGELFDRDMIAIRDDRNFTGVAASTAAGRLVIASQIDDKVALDLVRDDLGARFGLGEFTGTLVAPVLAVGETQVAITGGPSGLVANGFSGALWQAMPAVELTKSPIVSMSATPFLDDAMLAWTTPTRECHIQQLSTRAESVHDFGCEQAHIAVHPFGKLGMVVFVEDGDVYRADLELGDVNQLTSKVRIAEGGRSPRVAFDGERFWISYIGIHGAVVVGFVDHNGRLNSRGLDTVPTVDDAYDLAVFNGAPWVVGMSDDVFDGRRLCAVPE